MSPEQTLDLIQFIEERRASLAPYCVSWIKEVASDNAQGVYDHEHQVEHFIKATKDHVESVSHQERIDLCSEPEKVVYADRDRSAPLPFRKFSGLVSLTDHVLEGEMPEILFPSVVARAGPVACDSAREAHRTCLARRPPSDSGRTRRTSAQA